MAEAREEFVADRAGAARYRVHRIARVYQVDEAAGSDTGAIVARAEAKASRGDIAGAASELGQLPPDVRARAQAWIDRAQARQAAIDASRRLSADALAGAGK